MVEQQLVTTSNQLEGYRVSKQLGVLYGLTVRSRSIFDNIAGTFQTLVGGKTWMKAYDQMVQHANDKGANAIINMRYDANELMNGVTEVLCYGTAVQVVNV